VVQFNEQSTSAVSSSIPVSIYILYSTSFC